MLHYQTHGKRDGPVLCFLHRFMGSAADWTPIVEALGKSAYCVTIDLPEHGHSRKRPASEYSMEGATRAVADVLDAEGIEQCTLVGYSMGGRLALYFAGKHLDRVRRLALESASPGLCTEDERAQRRRLDAERAARIREDLTAFLEDWYRQPLFASLDCHGLVDEMVARRSANDPIELTRVLEGLGTGTKPSLWEQLSEVTVPTLVISGELDAKYDRITEQTADRLPTKRRVLVSKAGHNVHAERPQAYLAHLGRFLEAF